MIESKSYYEPVNLREYLTVLKTRRWWVLTTVAFVVVSALLFSIRQTPLYTSNARVLVQPIGDENLLTTINFETEAELIQSEAVAAVAVEKLDTSATSDSLLAALRVRSVTNTAVIELSFTDQDPAFAAAATNAFAESYLEYRRDRVREQIEASRADVQQRIDNVRSQLAEVTQDLDEARQDNDADLAQILGVERGALIARLGILQQQLDDLPLESSVALGGGEVIEVAEEAASPSSPNHTRNVLLASILGLALGVGFAFLRERLDDRFRGRMDVQRTLRAPVLATVPRFPKALPADSLAVLEAPTTHAAESYRTLRANIQFLLSEREQRSVLITSAGASEGKTSTAANLAVAMAQAGKRVILVSADLRKPGLHRYFEGVSNENGLSLWLAEGEPDLRTLLMDPGIPNLRVLPSGPVPPNPAEILSSQRLPQMIDVLQASCDYLIVDSVPVLGLADTVTLASNLAATVLVVDINTTNRSQVEHAREELERVGGLLLGGVINLFDPDEALAYYGQYAPAAAAEAQPDGRKTRRPRRQRAPVKQD